MTSWKKGHVSWCGKVRGSFPVREGSKEHSGSHRVTSLCTSIFSATLYDSDWQTTAHGPNLTWCTGYLSVNEVLLEHATQFIYIFYGCFHATTTELTQCDRFFKAHRVWNICSLALFRGVLTPTLWYMQGTEEQAQMFAKLNGWIITSRLKFLCPWLSNEQICVQSAA